MTENAERGVTHSTFVLEYTYPASPARVFSAWASAQAKSRWFVGTPRDMTVTEPLGLEFRVGGTERLAVRTGDGTQFVYEGCFQDIVPDERIVTTTRMYKDKQRISVSVATVELTADGDGTRLVLTEQGAYLDGLDEPAWREAGVRQQLAALAGEFDA